MKTHKVLFSRKGNENSTTPPTPIGSWEEQVSLDEKGTFCLSSDDDRPVQDFLYEVREILLPDFLSVKDWISNMTYWKYNWACGVDPNWSESWQKGLLRLRTVERLVLVELLKVKTFKSEFRKSLRAQLETWLETPEDQRKHSSPFSGRQYDTITTQSHGYRAKSLEARLYSYRGYNGVDPESLKKAK